MNNKNLKKFIRKQLKNILKEDTFFDFTKKTEQIANYKTLPQKVKELINYADTISSRGHQFLLGHKGNKLVWEAGGALHGDDFSITSIGGQMGPEKITWAAEPLSDINKIAHAEGEPVNVINLNENNFKEQIQEKIFTENLPEEIKELIFSANEIKQETSTSISGLRNGKTIFQIDGEVNQSDSKFYVSAIVGILNNNMELSWAEGGQLSANGLNETADGKFPTEMFPKESGWAN